MNFPNFCIPYVAQEITPGDTLVAFCFFHDPGLFLVVGWFFTCPGDSVHPLIIGVFCNIHHRGVVSIITMLAIRQCAACAPTLKHH